MSSFYADPALGGSGSTYTDDTNATTGLDNYGYTERLVPMFTDGINIATYGAGRATAAAASAVEAAASASSALNAPGTNATSTTSLLVATGSKAFTIQTGKAYVVGQTLVAASAADPAYYMAGQVTAYNSGTGALTILVAQIGTVGTKADWVISMGAIVSSTLPSMTSNSGKFLTNNGTVASWAAALIPSNNLSDVTTPATARTNLGLAIGTNVQAYDAGLLSIAGLTTAADRMIYTTALDVYAVATLTAAGRALLDDADAAAQRTTLGLVIGTNVQAYNANLGALAGLTLAADKLPYATGAGALALTDLSTFARTLLDDANGGAMRGTIGAAASGANNDITSLSALSTPLSKAQGGTGATAHYPILPGLATTSGGVLTDRFSPGFAISRTSTGIFVITLDTPAPVGGASGWCVVATTSNMTGDTAEQVDVFEDYTARTDQVAVLNVREGAGALKDPPILNLMVYVDA